MQTFVRRMDVIVWVYSLDVIPSWLSTIATCTQASIETYLIHWPSAVCFAVLRQPASRPDSPPRFARSFDHPQRSASKLGQNSKERPEPHKASSIIQTRFHYIARTFIGVGGSNLMLFVIGHLIWPQMKPTRYSHWHDSMSDVVGLTLEMDSRNCGLLGTMCYASVSDEFGWKVRNPFFGVVFGCDLNSLRGLHTSETRKGQRIWALAWKGARVK